MNNIQSDSTKNSLQYYLLFNQPITQLGVLKKITIGDEVICDCNKDKHKEEKR